MQHGTKVEEFAGQRILAMDPRTEKMPRVVCGLWFDDARPLGIEE